MTNSQRMPEQPTRRYAVVLPHFKEPFRWVTLGLMLPGLLLACGSNAGNQPSANHTSQVAAPYPKPTLHRTGTEAIAEPDEPGLHHGLFPVIDGRWVVLGEADESLAEGPIEFTLSDDTNVVSAFRKANSQAALKQVRVDFNRSMFMGSLNEAEACQVKLGALHVLRRHVPHFSQREDWNAIQRGAAPPNGAYELEAAQRDGEVKQALPQLIWEQGRGSELLVASLQRRHPNHKACDTASYAYFQRAILPDVFERYQPAPDDASSYKLTQAALSALQETEAYKKIQGEYQEFLAGVDPSLTRPSAVKLGEQRWETHGDAQPEFVFWRRSEARTGSGSSGPSKPQFVGWQLAAMESCADFRAELNGVFEVSFSGGAPSLRLVETNHQPELPSLITQDERGLELWNPSGIQAPNRAPRLMFNVPSMDCAC